jgi:RNA polymerase sigma-70 factor (ECF subfamily)
VESVAELLDRARAGDRVALDRLFGMCRSYIAVVAQGQVASWLDAKFDASDLAQQTMMEAYSAFADFRGQTSGEWLAWLRRILARNAIDLARRYGTAGKRAVCREVSLNGPAESSGPPDSLASPSSVVLAHERELLLAEALMQLSPDHRQVIILRNLEGLPFDEVAARMERSRPAAQMLWMRAIHALQAILTEASSPSR